MGDKLHQVLSAVMVALTDMAICKVTNMRVFLQAGKHDKAVAIIRRHGWWDKLHQVVRLLDPKADAAVLGQCADAFHKAGQLQFAKETYVRLGDHKVRCSNADSVLALSTLTNLSMDCRCPA